MVKAEELRIGNWVEDASTNKFVTVDGIQFSGRIVVADNNYDNFKRGIEPRVIQLTPEILGKCGFKQSRGNYRMFWHIEKMEIRLFDTFAQFKISSSHSIKITSLHQLQNLYFALTGEELDVKL